MVKDDRRKDNATAEAISAALKREAEYGYEVAPRQAAGTPVPAELAERLLEIGVDRRSAASGEQPEPGNTEAASLEQAADKPPVP